MPRRVADDEKLDSATTIVFTRPMREALDQRAETEDRSLGYIIREAVARYLEGDER